MSLTRVIWALALAAFSMFSCPGQPPLPPTIVLEDPVVHTNTLGWDDTNNPAGTRYKLLIGWAPGVYTMTNDTGTYKWAQVIWPVHQTSYYNVIAYNYYTNSATNGEIRLPQLPRTDTNIRIIVKGSNLLWALTLAGQWTTTNATVIVMTNPAGARFFRGSGHDSINKTNF